MDVGCSDKSRLRFLQFGGKRRKLVGNVRTDLQSNKYPRRVCFTAIIHGSHRVDLREAFDNARASAALTLCTAIGRPATDFEDF